MSQVIVTSKTNKKITLTITGADIKAQFGDINFSAERTATGFKTRIAADIGGGKRSHITVVLEGRELAKANAIFDELAASIAARREADHAFDKRRAAVLKMMNSDEGCV